MPEESLFLSNFAKRFLTINKYADKTMKILVTGTAGFIGAAVSKRLLLEGHSIVGADNLNSYYSPELKIARLGELGIAGTDINWNSFTHSSLFDKFKFIRINLEDAELVDKIFADEKFDMVIHLAARPGVRDSATNPRQFITDNINVFLNILEGCRMNEVKHLVFASSSSVYGLNSNVPFSENDGIAHPVSMYAATKKSNELMAHVYSHLYGLPVTGLRFFSVYGPWGRPDMSPYLFIDSILNDRPIKVYNHGDMLRDFTYIDDIVESVSRIAMIIPEPNKDWTTDNPKPDSSEAPYRIYNVGSQNPISLIDYISCIEKVTGKTAEKILLPMQLGDVYKTHADSSALFKKTGFVPSTPLEQGIKKTVEWFKTYKSGLYGM